MSQVTSERQGAPSGSRLGARIIERNRPVCDGGGCLAKVADLGQVLPTFFGGDHQADAVHFRDELSRGAAISEAFIDDAVAGIRSYLARPDAQALSPRVHPA